MCIYKTNDGKCKKFSDDKTLSYCVNAPCEYEKLSNYDRIRNMSIDEMVELLTIETWCQTCVLCETDCPVLEMSTKSCKENIKKWLESEVE